MIKTELLLKIKLKIYYQTALCLLSYLKQTKCNGAHMNHTKWVSQL